MSAYEKMLSDILKGYAGRDELIKKRAEEHQKKYAPDVQKEEPGLEEEGLFDVLKPVKQKAFEKAGIEGKTKEALDFIIPDSPLEAASTVANTAKKGVSSVLRKVTGGEYAKQRAAKQAATKAPQQLQDGINEDVRQVAMEYMKDKGIEASAKPFKNVNTEFASKVANAYDAMEHSPNDPKVKEAYDALIDETMDQFEVIKKAGLKVSRIEPGMENPYRTSKDLHRDIKENNHMWYYPTDQGFGSGDQFSDHPMLKRTGVKDGDKELLANDVFRIVHDYFGHVKEGTSFGPKGEETAYRIHKQMFSPKAQKALATETRGQNSWVNYGPYGSKNRANPKDTTYADQKAGLLPDWALEDYGD